MAVTAFDPEAGCGELEGKITQVDNAYGVLDAADALVVFTDWQEFRTPDFEQISKKLKKPLIFDGRNLYNASFVKKQGLEYYSIGRA